jgi:hypothetical protein
MPGTTTLTTKESIEPHIAAEMRKRWLRILPAVFVTYSLAYLDRANYGFGAAAGLAATLNITKSRAALLGAIFFLGYFLFQVPGAAYARRKARGTGFLCSDQLGPRTNRSHSKFWLCGRPVFLALLSFILPAMLILLMGWFTRAGVQRQHFCSW